MKWKQHKKIKMPRFTFRDERYPIWAFPWGPLLVEGEKAFQCWKRWYDDIKYQRHPEKYAEKHFRKQADEIQGTIEYNTAWRVYSNDLIRRHQDEINDYIITKLEIDGYTKSVEEEQRDGSIWVIFEKNENGA